MFDRSGRWRWPAISMATALWAAHPLGAQTPDEDFAARCSDPSVVRCYAFDDPVDLGARMYDPSGGPGLCTGNQCWQVDAAIKASGAGSLRFEIPSNSPADTSGSFWMNFADDFSVQFGENEDFYIQWRQRFSPDFVTRDYLGGGGWKQSIIGTGDQPGQIYYSCTALEVVNVNGYHRGFSQMYNSCTGSTSHPPFDGFEEPFGPFDFKLQNARPSPYCLYSQGQTNPPSYFPPTGNCFAYFGDDWMTFQVNIRTGPRVDDEFADSQVRLWIAREGQPAELAIDWGPYNLTAGPPNEDQRFGKIWLLPYNTGKDPSEDHPIAYAWYDELIVSRARIADPGAVPPSLSVDDVVVTEGDAGTTAAAFTVRLSAASAQAVSVGYATADQTATAGSDYQAASGTLSFAPGVLTSTVNVSVLGDTAIETDESFVVDLNGPVGATLGDGQGIGTISDDDAPSLSQRELVHGSEVRDDLSGQTGPAGEDAFRLAQAPRASYEVVLDGVSGDVVPAVLERLAADNVTVLQAGTPAGAGSSLSLRWENVSGAAVTNQHVRVRGLGCGSGCGAEDVYRMRSWETTCGVARFNNAGSQVTVLVLQNLATGAVSGHACFWSVTGTLLGAHAFALAGREGLVLNTGMVAGLMGQGGSVTVSHDGGYGALAGKAVALEPATGFTFDSPLVPRPR